MRNQELRNSKFEKICKLKSAVKDKTGTTLRITKKNFQDEELSHELFLTTRQKTKRRDPLTVCLPV